MAYRKQPSVSLRHRDDHKRRCTVERIENTAGRAIAWNFVLDGKATRFPSFFDAVSAAFKARFIHPVPVKDLPVVLEHGWKVAEV